MTAITSPRTSQHEEVSTSPKRTITKLVVLCAHGGYKASFEACFVDLGGLEKHSCWKTAESVMAWRGSPSIHKASPLGPVFGLAVVVPPQC